MTCGTGGWTGPLPGDPDNNIVLTATSVSGGIEVEWTYPTINPHAVAFVILHRGTTPNYYQSVQHKIVTANSYFDRIKVTQPTQYFYWIRIVSTNGTQGEPIGPASAFATNSVGELIEDLTGIIDSGLLAESLRTPIERIPLIEADLAAEAQARIDSAINLSGLISQIQTEYGNVQTLVLNEVLARETAVSSVVQSMDLMYADFEDQTAAIVAEQTVQADDISALSAQVTALTAAAGGDFATLLQNYETAVDAQAARAALSSTLTTNYQNYVSTLLQDYETISNANLARAALETQIQSDYENHVSNVLVNYQTIAAAEYAQGQLTQQLQTSFGQYVGNALSSYYTKTEVDTAIGGINNTAQAYTDGQLVSVREDLEAWIGEVDDRTDAIGALYTVRVDVNGMVGGFGVYNDGTSIEAGFDVDRFWVGKTNANRRKPFIIQDGTVYMDNAMIRQLTADKIDTRGLSIRDPEGNIILAAGTALNWNMVGGVGKPQDNATVGADATNLRVGIGGNLLPNSDFSSGINNWIIGYNPSGGSNYTLLRHTGNGITLPRGMYGIRLDRAGTISAAANAFGLLYARYIPVLPNTRYEVSAYVSVRRCSASVGVAYYSVDANGNYVALNPSSTSSTGSTAGGGESLADMGRVGFLFNTPANCTHVRIILGGSATISNDPIFIATRIFFAQALASQTTLSPWSDGSRTGAFAEVDQVNTTNAGVLLGNAIIGTAHIEDLAVNNAKIADLSIDTFKLGREAVVMSRYTSISPTNTLQLNTGTFALVATLPVIPINVNPGETASVVLLSVIEFIPLDGSFATVEAELRQGTNVIGRGVYDFVYGGYAGQFTLMGHTRLPDGNYTFGLYVRLITDYGGASQKLVQRTIRLLMMSAKK